MQIIVPTTITHPQHPTPNLKSPTPAEGDWILIDIQGSLHVELADSDSIHDLTIGSMSFENGAPVLIVGKHRLQGKKVALPKPIAVLRNHRPSQSLNPTPFQTPFVSTQKKSAGRLSIVNRSGGGGLKTPSKGLGRGPRGILGAGEEDEMDIDDFDADVDMDMEMNMDDEHATTRTPYKKKATTFNNNNNIAEEDDGNPSTTPAQRSNIGGLIGTPFSKRNSNTQRSEAQKIAEEQGAFAKEIVTILKYKYEFKTMPTPILSEEHRGLAGLKKGR
ncbi:hypothetical protein HDV05_007153 [Chytridiales sp. JEL 0842]|nr:hypothetical protein HDV05_007153 [Chytridiales sp. JEL 0842]